MKKFNKMKKLVLFTIALCFGLYTFGQQWEVSTETPSTNFNRLKILDGCENFDALTVGGLVAEQLGGMWTTWSGTSADDATVSDMYSNSPSNSFVVDAGAVDLVYTFGPDPLDAGVWSYTNYIYVPTGFSGYFNVQSEPTPGAGSVVGLYFDDGGTGSFVGQAAGDFTYNQDTWIKVEVLFDLDTDNSWIYFDDVLVNEFTNTMTIGGIDYYGSALGGAPGAYYDDVCFNEGEIPPPTCENFDALTVGGLVAEQLGGMWTTWSGTSADDATVSDMYSNSPSNSFVVDAGAVDLVYTFGPDPLDAGVWSYTNYIYVPTGFSGYFNVQSEPTPGAGSVVGLYFDDGGTGSFVGQAAGDFTYNQDTWIKVEVLFDLDTDNSWIYLDDVLVNEFTNTKTIGGIDYYGASGGGAPGAYYDDVCFNEGEIPPPAGDPPTNLTASVSENDVTLTWDAPATGTPNSFNIYRDNALLGNTTNLSYDDFDLTYETYEYYVTAVYDEGESDPSNTVTAVVVGSQQWEVITETPSTNFNTLQMLEDGLHGMAAGDGLVLTTENGGESWLRVTPIPEGGPSAIYMVSADSVWAVFNSGKIFATTDGGQTWVNQPSGTGRRLKDVKFIDYLTGWAVGGWSDGNTFLVLRTTNGGQTWENLSFGSASSPTVSAVSFIDAQTGWISGKADGGPFVKKTEDGGNSWVSQVLPIFTGTGKRCCDIGFASADIGWATTQRNNQDGEVIYTENGGETWTIQTTTDCDQSYLDVQDAQNVAIIGSDNGSSGQRIVQITTDGGVNWIRHDLQVTVNIYNINFIGSSLWFGANWARILHSTDMGENWELQFESTIYQTVDWIDNNSAWIVSKINTPNGFILRTDDGGSNWITDEDAPGGNYVFVLDENTAWIMIQGSPFTAPAVLYRTTDGGDNWATSTLPAGFLDGFTWVTADLGWAYGGQGNLRRSLDGGVTWTQQYMNTSNYIADVYFINELEGWACGGYAGENAFIRHTINGGATWTNQNPTITPIVNEIHFFDSSNGLAVANGGIVLGTSDGGVSWSVINTIPDEDLELLVMLDENTGWATGSSIYRTDDGGQSWTLDWSPTSVGGEISSMSINPAGNAVLACGSSNTIIRCQLSAGQQQIDIPSGYNFVSSRIESEDPDMFIVLQDLLNENLDFVRASNGTMFRKIGPNWVNGIGDWITTEGYLFKMFGDETLELSGEELNPLTPIDLFVGYQFISYLPTEAIDALVAFDGILSDDLDFVRNSNGEMLRKIGPNWVNGIGNANPGEGYLIKMFAEAELVYNIPVKSTLSSSTPEVTNNFVFEGGNAADPVYTIYVSGLNIGDEVAIFDGKKMVGASVVVSENVLENSVPIFSTVTEGKGYEANNPISIIVWDSQKQIEVPAIYTFSDEYVQAYTKTIFPESDGEFSVINIIKGSLGMMENTSLEVEIYPNPASDIMNIVSNNTITHIKVLNFIGQTMLEKAVNETKLSINTSAYQSGIYFIRIKTANGIKTEKLTIK